MLQVTTSPDSNHNSIFDKYIKIFIIKVLIQYLIVVGGSVEQDSISGINYKDKATKITLV